MTTIVMFDALTSSLCRETKFPRLEKMMQEWLVEYTREGKLITDAAIRQKAKSLVPELIATGAFKASTGWIDNFKARNGIRNGRQEVPSTSDTAQNASNHNSHAPGMETGTTNHPLNRPPDVYHENENSPGSSSEREDESAQTSNTNPRNRFGVEAADPDHNTETHDESRYRIDASYASVHTDTSMSVAHAQPSDETQDIDMSATEATHEAIGDHRPYRNPDPYAPRRPAYEEYPDDDYPEAYDEPGPSVRAAQTVDHAIDTVIAYVHTHDFFDNTEKKTLQKIKTLIFDYTTNGFVDRSRIPD